MIRFHSLAAALCATTLLSACPDQSLQAVNADPEATITSHADGDGLLEWETVVFLGIVSDADHEAEELLATWRLGGDQICAAAAPTSDGATSCEAIVGLEDTSLSLEVADPQGAAGVEVITLQITPTEGPEVTIVAPEPAGIYYSDQKITFEGLVSDAEDAPDELTARWESDLDGELDVAADPDSSGEILGTGYLSEGEHAIALYAEDSVGKTGSDSVVITVGPPNSAPSCEITSPESGAAGEEGALVTFEGLVSDEDVPADWLSVVWSSDWDGELGTSSPSTAGELAFSTSDLSVATHSITMMVSDEMGDTCSDFILYTVGTPPEVSISAPASGEVHNEGESISFAAQVSDNEDSATTLSLSWASDLDGVISTQGADSTGLAQFASSGLSAGDHSLSLTVTDSAGLYSIAMVSFTVNALPTAPTVSITPDPAYSDDDLTATASGSSDPDGSGTVSYSYAWYEAGVLSSASSSAIFPSSATTKGLAYRVVVTPSDGTGDGEPGEAAITVDNSAPVISTPVISPSSGVTTSETLTCSASATDADGDTPSISYAWFIGGSSLGRGASVTLTSSTAAPGDSITCTATATDSAGGTGSDSVSVTVENVDPTVDSVSISPSSGVTTSETLSCTATASDADGGTPTLSYAWTNGASSLGTGSSVTLTTSTSSPGDSITCTATATDADGGTASDSASVTVDNSAPSITSVSISPDPAYAADTLSCAYSGYADADGDADASSYAWTVDGSAAGSGSSLSGAFVGGDSVVCTVTPSDGTDTGTPVSDSLTISNTPPVLDAVTLTPDPAYEGDSLVCTPGSYADDDGDTASFAYAWDVDGVDPGQTSSTLSSSWFDRDETVSCAVTPNDGTDDGAAVSSNSIIISNTAPSISSVSISPASPTLSDSLTCSYSGYIDADGDADASTYAWTIDGAAAGSGSSFGGTLSSGAEVVCTVTPYDGTDTGTAVSDSVTVANSAPQVTSVTISPSSVYTDDTISASVSSTDADGDTVNISYAWYVDGSLVGATGSSLDGASYFDKDEEVYVEVTPDDGTESGTAVSSSSIVVLNTPPEAPVLYIDPETPAVGTDDLLCVVDSDSHDDDGDSISYSMSWTVDGVAYAAGGSADTGDTGAGWLGPDTTTWTDDTVPAEDTLSGQEWTCTATPDDGDDAGTAAEVSVTLSAELWSGVIEMPSTDTVDGFSHGEWSAMNGDGRVASRILLTQGCANPELAFYQHSSADTSIQGSYYVMDASGTVLDSTPFETYSGCNDCWLPHPTRLSVTMSANTYYYLGFQNGTGVGDMSGPSIYLDANARTVEIATFDDPRADQPGADILGLPGTSVGWQQRWRVDCE